MADRTYNCPNCGKSLMVRTFRDGRLQKSGMLRARVVFFDDEGGVLGKCSQCKTVVHLPLSIIHREEKTLTGVEKPT